MDIVSLVKQGVSRGVCLKWPGTELRVKVRVLTIAEEQEAYIQADRYLSAKKVDFSIATSEIYTDERNTQIIWRAIVDDNGNRLFQNMGDFRESLTAIESEYFVKAYNNLLEDNAPLTTETLESLKKN